MVSNKVIHVDFEKCELISRVVDIEEVDDPWVINIWMLEDDKKTTRISITYIVFQADGAKYISDALYESLDLIRLKLLRKGHTNLYIDTLSGEYAFDLDFLKSA